MKRASQPFSLHIHNISNEIEKAANENWTNNFRLNDINIHNSELCGHCRLNLKMIIEPANFKRQIKGSPLFHILCSFYSRNVHLFNFFCDCILNTEQVVNKDKENAIITKNRQKNKEM